MPNIFLQFNPLKLNGIIVNKAILHRWFIVNFFSLGGNEPVKVVVFRLEC
jgi:hypothetical protein